MAEILVWILNGYNSSSIYVRAGDYRSAVEQPIHVHELAWFQDRSWEAADLNL
jgi:hypothetical protein